MREEIIKAQELEVRDVDAFGWGTVRVSEISATDRGKVFRLYKSVEADGEMEKEKKDAAAMAIVVAFSMVDDKGERLFAGEEWPILARKNHNALKAVYDVAAELNGFGQTEEEALGESEPSQSDSSPTP